jgi:acetylserotonin N-methyltransferase
MTYELPTVDDRPIWDVLLATYRMPALAAADALNLFETLYESPASAEELSARTGLAIEPLKALLPMLSALGFLVPRLGRYQLTPTARIYLLHDSPFYWGHAFTRGRADPMVEALLEKLQGKAKVDPSLPNPGDQWEAGQVTPEMAALIARFMHSHSLPAATGAAREGNFTGVRRLLDVGGGSGVFSIALAQKHPNMGCTVMELPTMCARAKDYIAAEGMADRIDTVSVDMFRAAWPKGYDAIFLSNIFHDWSTDTNRQLSASAFAALPSGGRIYLHEMLIDDEGSGPLPAASFSIMMLFGTRGRQYSLLELKAILEGAGFTDVGAANTYGYYSVVSARKP